MNEGQRKYERVMKTMAGEETDRVPHFDPLWAGFQKKWKEKYGDHNIAEYYDHDMMWFAPNYEPLIMPKKIIEKSDTHEIAISGFGYKYQNTYDCEMYAYLDPMCHEASEMDDVKFDSARDSRRFIDPIDCLYGQQPPFAELAENNRDNFMILGCAPLPFEYYGFLRGMDGLFIDVLENPEAVRRFNTRYTDWLIELIDEATKYGVRGFNLTGDCAYNHGMMISPDLWREYFLPDIKRIWAFTKEKKLFTMHHSDGDCRAIYSDLVEVVDCINPLEVKAAFSGDSDVVHMRKLYPNKCCFEGNIDAMNLENGTPEDVKREVMYKLNAAKGGRYIASVDHSITDDVPPENYDMMQKTIIEFGKYPLNLGEYDVEM